MIAEQGIAVSLREVAVEAGQKNNSAVQYHFGTREALIQAIIELRQGALERERLALLAEHEAEGRTELRALVEALIGPMFTTPYAEESTHYARFLEKVRDHPAMTEWALTDSSWAGTKIIVGRMSRLLTSIPREVRELRLRAMITTTFALLADVERSPKLSKARRTLVQENVLDMLVGLLTAPEHA
jgi:AcrR family transcriptional regulator